MMRNLLLVMSGVIALSISVAAAAAMLVALVAAMVGR